MKTQPTWRRALAAVTQAQRVAACREMDGWTRGEWQEWLNERNLVESQFADLDGGDSDWIAYQRVRAQIARKKLKKNT